MSAEQWVVGISVAIIALAFVVLVIFLIRTLISLTHSLSATSRLIRDADFLVADLQRKMHSFDPLLNVVDSFGQKIRKRCSCEACRSSFSCSCPNCEKCGCTKGSCDLCCKEKHEPIGCCNEKGCNCQCSSCCGEKKKSSCCEPEQKIEQVTRSAIDFAEWALLGISIWQRIKQRKR